MTNSTQVASNIRALGAFLCVALFASAASATNWYASPDGTGGGTSPTDRGEVITTVLKMKSNDTIYLAPGTYNLDETKGTNPNLGYGYYLRLGSTSVTPNITNLTVIGESDNPEDIRLVGTPTYKMRIFYCPTGGHVVRNVLMSGGCTSYQGAGICMADSFRGKHEQAFTASNCVVENCQAVYKGACRGGVWRNCVIRNNKVLNTKAGDTEGTGGGVFNATLYDCVITNNTAGLAGGGLAGCVNEPTIAYNCLIGWNQAPYGGGAGVSTSFTARAYCKLYNCTVVSNTASKLGGGAYLCTISNSVVCTNSVPREGSNAVDGGTAAGGGVAYCDVLDSTLEGNRCQRSGAGAAKSNLEQCRIINNYAVYWGGGTFDCPHVKDCLLAGNTGNHGGAGFMGYFENCVMTNNVSNPYHGSATYNATTRNCIVVGNYATTYLAHCRGAHYGDLVYGNKNGYTSYPSGIGADTDREGETVPVVNCTVWGNLNGSKNVGRATLTNSVVWSVENIYSAVNSFWHNGTVANQTGCISGADKNPKFVGIDGTVQLTEAQAKSAPPSAWALRASSPCRDAGLTLPGQAAEKDAFGNPRVKYGMVDMGALECIQSLGTYFLFR